MYQKLSLVTIGILLFGVFITSALGSINGGWVSSLIKGGTNSGSLGFWSPDTPQASTPQMTLTQSGMEVNGGMRIIDGTQGLGKVLMSDAMGHASWQNPASIMPTIIGNLGTGVDILPTDTAVYKYTGTNITLPANSKYIVNANMLMSTTSANISYAIPVGSSLWLRSTFSDNNTCAAYSPDMIGSFLISGAMTATNGTWGMVQGSIILKNPTNSPKTYYYCAGRVDAFGGFSGTIFRFGGAWSENQIYAIPIN